MDETELLNQLIAQTRAVRENAMRHGKYEYHIACPKCNHESSPKDPHCSFSIHGWKCLSCGEKGSLWGLAKLLELDLGKEYTPPSARIEYPQEFNARPWMTQGVTHFESHPRRYELWQAYKPLTKDTIFDNRLGVGVLPENKRCNHERLIVPIFDNGNLVGLRGRQFCCDCDKKWLTSYGTLPGFCPLYNIDAVKPGSIIFIVENPVDALLLTQMTEYTGVATYSTAYWFPRWENELKSKCPEQIFIAYDNDLPGNGGADRRDEFIEIWLADPKHKRVPESAGIKRMLDLKAAGLKTLLFDWERAEYKTDIGSYVTA